MNAAQLRALAHPLRVQLMQVLYGEGPATASQLARRLGESSGATSYHLRALHKAGFVVEGERRNGRERWWQRPEGPVMIPNSVPPDASESERADLMAAHAQLESVFLERDEQALGRWLAIRYDLPLDWQDSQWLGNFRMWATAAEVREFGTRVFEMAKPLRIPPDSPDSERREVHFTFRVLPQAPELETEPTHDAG
jgi:DNA-binding transcriptional ArsR family regulator